MDDKEFKEKYEYFKNSKFRQQKLPGWRPTPTLSCVTIIFISFAVFFILVGILILVFTSQVKEIILRYDRIKNENDTDTENFCSDRNVDECSIIAPEKMKKPIMIYYQIDGFYQNHRAYMDSKSDKQLQGEEPSEEELKKSGVCEYALYNKDLGRYNIDNANIENNLNEVAFPCGLIAKTYPNEELKEWNIGVTVENIAYETDKEKYEKIPSSNSHWIDTSDEHFMIWMRPSPFKSPRKLWGIIDKDDIEKGSTIKFSFEKKNYYDHRGSKYIIFSTRNIFGGKSSFLGLCYLIFGIICLATSIIFINLYHIFHKK